MISFVNFGMRIVYHSFAEDWILALQSGTIKAARLSIATAKRVPKGDLMLAARHRFSRNPYFHFHPLHTLFSLMGALLLFGLLIWFLAVPAR